MVLTRFFNIFLRFVSNAVCCFNEKLGFFYICLSYFVIRKYFCNFALYFERGGTFSSNVILYKVIQM